MNAKKIEEAFILLKQAIEEKDDEPVTLTLALSKRDLDVFRYICKANLSVPAAVADTFCHLTRDEVKFVLDNLYHAIGYES